MKKWLDEFLSEFHKNHMKELGFKKVRRTFSRDKGEYWERYNFQGSAWNYPDQKDWRYYINIGVEFKDLKRLEHWSYFPQTHWAARIGAVVKSAPAIKEYNENTDKTELAKKLKENILEASKKISEKIEILRKNYLEGKHLEKYPFNE